MEEKFNVIQFFDNDSYERVLTSVSAQEALQKVEFLTRSVGAQIGTTKKVIITDSGDFTNWEWVHGKGLIYPLYCDSEGCYGRTVTANEPCKKCGIITAPKAI